MFVITGRLMMKNKASRKAMLESGHIFVVSSNDGQPGVERSTLVHFPQSKLFKVVVA